MSHETLLERRNRLLGAGTTTFYRDPVHIVRGEGVWLYGPSGERYLDLYNNVPCVGHTHPRVVAAMQRQAATLNVHSRYLHEGILAYAERLTALHAEPLTSVVFTCTGTEASEVALMMARAATGGRGIVSTAASYHGNSAEVRKLSVTRQSEAHPDYRAIPVPQRYRPIEEGLDDEALTERYLAELRAAIEGFEHDGVPFAGMMLCSILANEGLPDIPARFMPRAAELVRAAGGLVIADEVQAGFCRTGRWWGYQLSGFEPDIVTMGKPMGNGLPIAAVAAGADLVATFRERTRYFNTFASTPLQAAVGMAVLDVIEEEGIPAGVADVGAYLLDGLKRLQPSCEPMGDVRGKGLFVAIDWVRDRDSRVPDRAGAEDVVERLRARGFLISTDGEHHNVLKIRPPLVFGREHADLFLEAFAETIRDPDRGRSAAPGIEATRAGDDTDPTGGAA